MSARRRFLESIALGCAGALSWGPRGIAAVPCAPAPHAAAMQLAAHVVQAMGSVAPSLNMASAPQRSIEQLLVTIFGPMLEHDSAARNLVQDLAELSTAQLQRLLALRIQQDYQRGALVQHQGWWLADSEAAILELGCRPAERTPSGPA